MYKRILEQKIKNSFFKGKIAILVGARQTGKTTLAQYVIKSFSNKKSRSFNGDNPTDRDLLSNRDFEFLDNLVGSADIIFIDEGQKIETIGQTLKLMVDKYKNKKQIIVTGSSSFNLLDRTQEPLTGRKNVFHMFSLSLEELYPENNQLEIIKELERLLIYGTYPEVSTKKDLAEKRKVLDEITSSYLYKDVLEFQGIKKSDALVKLLKALALQIGSEVSYTELANISGLNKKTVESYVDILEKNYIIFRLSPYAKNKRKVISKLRKIYFYDLGVRNSLINSFNLFSDRSDGGALWENFLAVERIKFQNYHEMYVDNYFWRTYDGAEIDWVEEREGKVFGYEFKWNKKAKLKPLFSWKDFSKETVKIISPYSTRGFII